MEFRKLGRTGLEVSIIGLGTEHLEKSNKTRDAVLGMATDAGVNYVDLLYVEPEYWDAFGPLFKRYRKQFVVAAHWGAGDRYEIEYSQQCFDNILAHMGNDHAEIGLLTMVDDEAKWDGWAQESIARLHRYQEQGHIGHIGLSGHEKRVALKAIESGLIDVLMFPVNLLGHDEEEDHNLYQACVEQGVGLVAMKPYHGGTLFSVEGKSSGISPAQCLAYVFSLPVSTAVPGIKNVEELRATLHYLQATDEERDYSSITANITQHLAGQCVYCHHCLPCPEGIGIGWIIWLVDHVQGGVTDNLRTWYAGHEVKASACIQCGDCTERCPFGVDIIAKMHQAVEIFEVRAA